MTPRQTLEREFDAVMAKEGIVIPADWRQGALDGYVDARRWTALLRNGRPPESEPAAVYDLIAILRSL